MNRAEYFVRGLMGAWLGRQANKSMNWQEGTKGIKEPQHQSTSTGEFLILTFDGTEDSHGKGTKHR